MTLEQILAFIVAANTIVTFATTGYTLLSARATKALEAIDKLLKRLDTEAEARKTELSMIHSRFEKLELKVQAVEGDMKHMPDRDHAHKMEVAIAKLDGTIATLESRLVGRIDTLDERLKPVDALGRRLQEMLVRQAETSK